MAISTKLKSITAFIFLLFVICSPPIYSATPIDAINDGQIGDWWDGIYDQYVNDHPNVAWLASFGGLAPFLTPWIDEHDYETHLIMDTLSDVQLGTNQATLDWINDYIAFKQLDITYDDKYVSSATFNEYLDNSLSNSDDPLFQSVREYKEAYKMTIEEMDKAQADISNYQEVAREEQLFKMKKDNLRQNRSHLMGMYKIVLVLLAELSLLMYYILELLLIIFLVFDVIPTMLIWVRNAVIKWHYEDKK